MWTPWQVLFPACPSAFLLSLPLSTVVAVSYMRSCKPCLQSSSALSSRESLGRVDSAASPPHVQIGNSTQIYRTLFPRAACTSQFCSCNKALSNSFLVAY